MHLLKPLAPRQQLIEMPAPARRVLAAAQPLRLGRIQHPLDSGAQPAGRLRYPLP
jgi:hypothetical protein